MIFITTSYSSLLKVFYVFIPKFMLLIHCNTFYLNIESSIRVQILDQTLCVAVHANALGKIDLSNNLPAIDKLEVRLCSLVLIKQQVQEKNIFKAGAFYLKMTLCYIFLCGGAG